MFEPIKDISKARILISNDDGFDAKGIKLLEKIALSISSDVWVVAPDSERSASGHALTITKPLRANKISEKHFTVDGTPTDCVLVAITRIMSECRPDIVLSGINNGGNLSDDVTYSGTVAAAMEGLLLNVRSIALSQCYSSDRKAIWETSEKYAADIIKKLVSIPCDKNVLMNVNFPAVIPEKVNGIDVANLGKRSFCEEWAKEAVNDGIDPRGRSYYWVAERRYEKNLPEGTDIASILNGNITITPLTLDMTHNKSINELKKVFA